MFTVTTRPPASALAFAEYAIPETHRGLPMDVDDDLGEGSSRRVVTPGEVITSSKDYMRGHGTYVEDEQVAAAVAGTIQRVNKLVSVRPLNSRYTPEIGDLVIGRIVEVGNLRWKVDTNARQDAILMLSSVNLPGGVQRRKIESDALKMREFLAEGDLLVAEVQAFFQDGAMSLHTRSLKYGKLRNGRLLSIQPRLIRRLKSHFHHIPPPCGPTGVDLILGLNGYVWVSMGTAVEQREGGEGFDAEGVYSDKNDASFPFANKMQADTMQDISPEGRVAISTIANLVQMLAAHDVPLSDTLIDEAYAWYDRHGPDTPLDDQTARKMIEEITGVDVDAV